MKNNLITLGPVFYKLRECFIEIHSTNPLIYKLIFDYLKKSGFKIFLYKECIDVSLDSGLSDKLIISGSKEKELVKCLKDFCSLYFLGFENKNIFDST